MMAEKKKKQVVVVGAGPGGYVAAIRAASLGLSVALIEKGALGGTCLNVGCIPSKALISGAALVHQIKRAETFGISVGQMIIEYKKMKERKDAVVSKIRSSLEGLIRSHQVEIIRGTAQLESPRELKVIGENPTFLEAEAIVLATGSVPTHVPAFPCDGKRILDSTSLLELTELPKRLAVIGGGYIGCEFASLFIELGCQVTIIESLPSILSLQGNTVSQFMTRSFTSRGVILKTGAKVSGVKNRGDNVLITLENQETLEADYVLVAVGRKPYTEGLHLEKAGLATNPRGFLEVNERMETAVKGIYAIGDLTGHSLLAHVASHQGIIAAEVIAGRSAAAHYDTIPAVIFTFPEVASVGLTKEKAKEAGFSTAEGVFPFAALGKSQGAGETEGMAEVIADAKTGQILGATVIGHEASNLIAEMALAMENELTLDCIWQTIHAHPTQAECWHEAAGVALGHPIHLPPKKW